MEISNQFQQAVEDSKNLPEKPSNEVMLQLYALYKQATVGDVNIEPPGILDFVGTAKYNTWSHLKGTSPEKAMKDYILLVEKLKA